MAAHEGILILHLSDLHFGNENRFADRDLAALGKAFFRAVERARTLIGIAPEIQLVIVSGDLAEVGNPREFAQAEQFLGALFGEMDLEHSRLVFAPGNHDLSWPRCKQVVAEQEIEGFDDNELRRRIDDVKLQFYDQALVRWYGESLDQLSGRGELAYGGWLHDFPELQLSIAALNTCERESHEVHGGYLGEQQAQPLMDAWRREPYPCWLKVVVVHHNPIATTPGNVEQWTRAMKKQPELAAERIHHYAADVVGFQGHELLRRIVADCHVHLVLHGHHHDQGDPIEWPWRNKDGRAPVLSTGSWGLQDGKLPGDAPPSCQFLWLATHSDQPRLDAYPLVYHGRFRLEGDLLPGNFTLDPASYGRYSQALHLPPGWAHTTSPFESVGAEGKSAGMLNDVSEAEGGGGIVRGVFKVFGTGTQPPLHRQLLRDLERALGVGELKDSELGPLVLQTLQREVALELAEPYDPMWMTSGIRLGDFYFMLIRSSAGQRDWQRDFAKTATPILVGVTKSLRRSVDAQAVIVRLCTVFARRLRLKVIWPSDPDELNDVTNALYRACLDSHEIECDDVLMVLQRLNIAGPS